MQHYPTSFANAPGPADQSAFAYPSHHFMHGVGVGADDPGLGTPGSFDTNAPLQLSTYWPQPSQLITDEDPAKQPKPRVYCHFSGCGASFGRKPDLDRHVNSLHCSPRAHACSDCSRVFNRKDNLTAHYLNVHVGVKKQSPR
ncbi:hypothetical protein BDV06DRAFT_205229 [Aspergillus oleicola]